MKCIINIKNLNSTSTFTFEGSTIKGLISEAKNEIRNRLTSYSLCYSFVIKSPEGGEVYKEGGEVSPKNRLIKKYALIGY